MSFPDLIPSTDNFFKYILTIGFVFLVFAIVYPIQNQNKLEIEKITLKEAIAIDSVDQLELKKQFDVLFSLRKEITDSINKLNALGTNAPIGSKQKVDSFINAFSKSKKEFHNQAIEIQKQTIKTDFAKKRFLALNDQVGHFKTIRFLGVILGVILMSLGLIFWAGSSYHDEITKAKDNTPAHTIYTKCFKFCSEWPKFLALIYIIAMILIVKALIK